MELSSRSARNGPRQWGSHPAASLTSKPAGAKQNARGKRVIFVDLPGLLDNLGFMKTILAILLGFIVSEAPVLAIHGGYTLGSAQSAIGTYAGVLVPVSDINLSGTTAVTGTTGAVAGGFGSNSLGIFTLSIPSSGIGGGQVLIFSSAQGMSGTITALPDPNM